MSNSGMRSGFVVLSLVTHLTVVGLATRVPEPSPPPPASRLVDSTESGLVTVELDAPATAKLADEPMPATDPKARAQAPSPDRAGQRVDSAAATRAARRAPAAAAPERLPPRTTGRPASPPAAKPAPQPASKAPASEAGPTAANVNGASDDWMSLDQQLAPAGDLPATPAVVPAPPDPLVERLLAAERNRAATQQREENQRRKASQLRQAARNAMASTDGAAAERGAAYSPASDAAKGQSHDRADVWVELTRWLPRAASSDQTWDRLASSTRFDFKVEATIERGALTRLAVRDAAVPDYVARLLSSTQHLMQRGQFAEQNSDRRTFEVRIELSQTRSRELWIGHTIPKPPDPGQGTLILPSGRRFDATVSEIIAR